MRWRLLRTARAKRALSMNSFPASDPSNQPSMRTVGVFLERQARRQRTASAGWYNSDAFHQLAGDGHVSINAGAFTDNTKQMEVHSLRAGSLTSRTRRPQPGYRADRPRWLPRQAEFGRLDAHY